MAMRDSVVSFYLLLLFLRGGVFVFKIATELVTYGELNYVSSIIIGLGNRILSAISLCNFRRNE